jgi:hypothetical protein
MLTSITPLGERGRGSRWGVTVFALAVGSALAGAAAGLAAGAVGKLALDGLSASTRLALLGAVLVVGLALDVGATGLPLPGPRRQVNEQWLGAYRGWVYGLGFGLQLGLGVATIVSASAVYATFASAAAAATPAAGAAIGVTFGFLRAGTVLSGRRVSTPAALHDLGQRLELWRLPARRVGLAAQAVLAVLALGVGL